MSKFVERTVRFDRGAGPEEGHTYVFPEIREIFSSPLVNERNLEISAGGPWQVIVDQVERGFKPVGFLESGEEQMRAAAQQGLAAGCAVQNYQHSFNDGSDPCWFTSVAQTGRIEELFDVASLIADYNAYFLFHPEVSEAIERELDKIRRRDVSSFLSFRSVEADIWKDEKRTGPEYARCGLLLGYPVWSTVAIIGKCLKLPCYGTSAL